MREQYPRVLEVTRAYFSEAERPLASLRHEIAKAEVVLAASVKFDLLTHEREALIALLSDITGRRLDFPQSFRESLLMRYLNDGYRQLAQAEWMRLVMVGGHASERMMDKRSCECCLFRTGRVLTN